MYLPNCQLQIRLRENRKKFANFAKFARALLSSAKTAMAATTAAAPAAGSREAFLGVYETLKAELAGMLDPALTGASHSVACASPPRRLDPAGVCPLPPRAHGCGRHPALAGLPAEVLEWQMESLDYNVPGGKLNRGLSVVHAYVLLPAALHPRAICHATHASARLRATRDASSPRPAFAGCRRCARPRS